ncbi:hypothetical protein Ciccas_000361 [Cichlidogyrus casuarinus]|uniref:Uncharacterized protein n=1 Tax=Cichlidogyrus casuarinus TaxID=1844966 RepID=A0ABD2QR33_9PLAT
MPQLVTPSGSTSYLGDVPQMVPVYIPQKGAKLDCPLDSFMVKPEPRSEGSQHSNHSFSSNGGELKPESDLDTNGCLKRGYVCTTLDERETPIKQQKMIFPDSEDFSVDQMASSFLRSPYNENVTASSS